MTQMLSDLQNDVLSRLNEASNSGIGVLATGTGGAPTIATLATITQYLNEAMAAFCRECYPVPAIGTYTWAAGAKYVGLTNFTISSGGTIWAVRGVSYAGVQLQYCSRAALELWFPTWQTDASGTPLYWFLADHNSVAVYPTPTLATATVSIDGYAIPPSLVNQTDVITAIMPDEQIALVFHAAARLAEKNQQDENLAPLVATFMAEYQKRADQAKARILPSVLRAHFGGG